MKSLRFFYLSLLAVVFSSFGEAVSSYDLGFTITKVRTAQAEDNSFIAASTYEGTALGISFKGQALWKNALSGIKNYEIACRDLNSDGIDEILYANADGSLYCLDHTGELLWQFKPNDVPMVSVCAIRGKSGEMYIACGGYDLNFYWLSTDGELLKTVPSSGYETGTRPSKKWSDDGTLAYNVHVVNFLRAIPQKDGSDVLVLDGAISNNAKSAFFHFFEPLATTPYKLYKTPHRTGPIGEMRVRDIDGDGNHEIIWGSSAMHHEITFAAYDPKSEKLKRFKPMDLKPRLDFGYHVLQPDVITTDGSPKYFILAGQRLMLAPQTADPEDIEIIEGVYSYNDVWVDSTTGKVILASAQSGGSAIHILDTNKSGWKQAFAQITPPGKIQAILDNTAKLKQQLADFSKPEWEGVSAKTFLMTVPKGHQELIESLKKYPDSPAFLGNAYIRERENWDRSVLGNKTWEALRDNRMKYDGTHEAIVEQMVKSYSEDGLSTWGGHGVDPYFYSPETLRNVIVAGEGRKSVFIWPELTIVHKDEFPFVIEKLFAPLAEFGKQHNSMIFLRNKHNFWIGDIHQPIWKRFLSGEFADVAIPSMEETADMTMELSLAGRLGVWTSGSFDSWGTRCARDNPSFNRSRQFSNQNLPNHFLRNAVFHISYGAQYINNFTVPGKYDDYMTVLWELIAKGALYVPRREEIVSFSPVHLSMKEPDDRFIREGHSMITNIRYDSEFHPNNPYVFGRLDAAWCGGQVTDWDFSKYAAGVKDRRQNFLAPYSNGMVLVTPPQDGVFADEDAPRGALVDNLHPLYKDILKEHITDGRHYYSADGKQTFAADKYYQSVQSDIVAGAKQIPITISGEVAWVAAQIDETHIRLTLIDNGYLNPNDRIASVQFNTIQPVKLTDILSDEVIEKNGSGPTEITIPCGLFRIIDVELSKPL